MVALPADFDECGGADNALAYLPEQDPGTRGLFIGFIPLPQRYTDLYEVALSRNVRLMNTLEEHRLAMEFDRFYPLIADLTFESRVIEDVAQLGEAEDLGYPLFVKGAIKSDKERGIKFCVAQTREELLSLCEPLLRRAYTSRNKVVVRRFERLRHVRTTAAGFPVGREYRVFLLSSKVVAYEYYWGDEDELSPLTSQEKDEVLGLAQQCAVRLKVPFLAVDIGQLEDGRWKVVETGDPQCSGLKERTALKVWAALRDAVMSTPEIPIVCTLTSEELRERRTTLLDRVGRAVQERQEREQGFAYRFAPDAFDDLVQVIRLERQCCAFLRFSLTAEPGNGPLWLEVTGPVGTKDFLGSFLHG